MASFSGQYKNTTLVGKKDLTQGASVIKTPLDNVTIHEYTIQPNITTSTDSVSDQTVTNIKQIIENTKTQVLDGAEKYDNIISKINSPTPSLPDEVQAFSFAAFRSVEQNIMDRVWVAYNFDGDVVTAAPYSRACAFGGENGSFTWFDFINGQGAAFEGYNPAGSGQVHPWSIRAWYQWGARQFELHSPFGRPVLPVLNPIFQNWENLSYQADSFICARDGWSDLGIQWGSPMAWLTNDFIDVWKALISGRQGKLTNQQWQIITEWFNPNDPITVLTYNGTISRYGAEEENQYPRWNRLFALSYDDALQRLKDSVQPLIECGMLIGLDALSTCPGEEPGAYIPGNLLSGQAQMGWWEFFSWLKDQVGLDRLWVEAGPHVKTRLDNGALEPSPYLGMNVISAEDWSYYPDPTKHRYSELGRVKYMRNYRWGGVGPKTARFSFNRSPARYTDLNAFGETGSDGDRRIPIYKAPEEPGAATFMDGLQFLHIYAARNLIDRFDLPGDTGTNRTIPHFMLPHNALQVFPDSFVPTGQQRFIDRCPNANAFKTFLNTYQTPYLPVVGIDDVGNEAT